MPSGGPRPNSGRPKGSKNRRPRQIIQKRITLQSVANEVSAAMGRPMPGRKLGKEVLSDLMSAFVGMAVQYQPAPIGQPPKLGQDEEKFLIYSKLVQRHMRSWRRKSGAAEYFGFCQKPKNCSLATKRAILW
jgi:hypothetical protein